VQLAAPGLSGVFCGFGLSCEARPARPAPRHLTWFRGCAFPWGCMWHMRELCRGVHVQLEVWRAPTPRPLRHPRRPLHLLRPLLPLRLLRPLWPHRQPLPTRPMTRTHLPALPRTLPPLALPRTPPPLALPPALPRTLTPSLFFAASPSRRCSASGRSSRRSPVCAGQVTISEASLPVQPPSPLWAPVPCSFRCLLQVQLPSPLWVPVPRSFRCLLQVQLPSPLWVPVSCSFRRLSGCRSRAASVASPDAGAVQLPSPLRTLSPCSFRRISDSGAE
jgi:hypothetical protein